MRLFSILFGFGFEIWLLLQCRLSTSFVLCSVQILPVCLVRTLPKHLSRCQPTKHPSIKLAELNLSLTVESTTVLYTGWCCVSYKLSPCKLWSCVWLLSEGDQSKLRTDREDWDSKLFAWSSQMLRIKDRGLQKLKITVFCYFLTTFCFRLLEWRQLKCYFEPVFGT